MTETVNRFPSFLDWYTVDIFPLLFLGSEAHSCSLHIKHTLLWSLLFVTLMFLEPEGVLYDSSAYSFIYRTNTSVCRRVPFTRHRDESSRTAAQRTDTSFFLLLFLTDAWLCSVSNKPTFWRDLILRRVNCAWRWDEACALFSGLNGCVSFWVHL